MSQDSSGEKTEKATPKKRKDAREKGQVFKSQELNTAACCIVIFAFMLAWLPNYLGQMSKLFTNYLGTEYLLSESGQFNVPMVQRLMGSVMLDMLKIIGPLLLVAFAIGIVINILQVGFLFTAKPLAPKMERISFLKGLKRIFSMQTLVTLIKSIAKIVVLVYIFYGEYIELMGKLPALTGADLYTSFFGILEIGFNIALKMSLFIAILGAADFLYQWWKFEKDLKMTKQEIKDEYKTTEGDPQIKGRIRQKQRQMSAMRMMDAVPSADVVITNPTHYAVAIKYEDGVDAAPIVVAKGQDHLARKIKERAIEYKIQLVENKELARTLYAMCNVGQEIPPDLYQAVADVLVFVYRQKAAQKMVRR